MFKWSNPHLETDYIFFVIAGAYSRNSACKRNCSCYARVYTIWVLFQGQISGKNIEIGIVGADRKFRYYIEAVAYGLWLN
ncbi:hypothetical protein BHE74_00015937 [Ensete ventricosum]|nr:hypothetical protein GW17_00053741 [Ensete ventricosum]RWW76000.1 hypothetical protein BHE74_00015937 [Ensete ventricosum]RZS16416.1 hypothetical protein BHM03_00048403 [Ensete ventricosum]